VLITVCCYAGIAFLGLLGLPLGLARWLELRDQRRAEVAQAEARKSKWKPAP
jgi:hypothetical protein